jgi:heme/copper-type cytochrome/quinol oxidase subunit 3
MNVRVVGDVSTLPEAVYGHRAPQWWGLIGMIAIEGTVFALCIATYFYLRLQAPTWPPHGFAEPALDFGTLNTGLILFAAVPMYLMERHALRHNWAHVLLHVAVFLVLCAAILVVRVYEFRSFHVKWDSNAYGSIVWITLFFHSLHLLTTFLETAVLGVYVGLRGLDDKRALDFQLNTFYWYFIIASWAVLYVVLYFGPRMLN